MKLTFILLINAIYFTSTTFGQANDISKNKYPGEVGFDLCGIYTPILTQNFYGFNFDIKYYPKSRYGTGVSILISQNKISNSFTFSISQPIVSYYEVGWINQYIFWQTEKIKLNLNLTNGISVAELGDNAIKEKYPTKYGYEFKPKSIVTNYFYLLEPGADISIKLFSNNHNPDFWLTAKSKYRFLFGDSKYSSTQQFSNNLFAIGLTIIGFAK